MKMHKEYRLKTDPEVFQQSWVGLKPWEIRYNDRDFKQGDTVLLLETRYAGSEMEVGAPLEFTGRRIHAEITNIVCGYGLLPGWLVMTIDVRDCFIMGKELTK